MSQEKPKVTYTDGVCTIERSLSLGPNTLRQLLVMADVPIGDFATVEMWMDDQDSGPIDSDRAIDITVTNPIHVRWKESVSCADVK